MIHIENNLFSPGSPTPERIKKAKGFDDQEQIQDYLSEESYQVGTSLLIHGATDANPTQVALTLFAMIEDSYYWLTSDFIKDTTRLWWYEDMVKAAVRDDGLWLEFLEWERNFYALREAPVLILDGLHLAYTGMHYFELETLLKHRRDKPTIVVADSAKFAALPATLRAEASLGITVAL